MKILCIGDIVGRPGRATIKKILPKLKLERKIDFVIANGENLAGYLGMTYDTYKEMIDTGIDYFTSGNHIWKKKDFIPFLDKKEIRVLRPANYPEGAAGQGYVTLNLKKKKIAIINLIGKAFMSYCVDYTQNPFLEVNKILAKNKAKITIVDFHGEATSEKKNIGYYLDGRVSCVFGTHTHVATADCQILPKGTAYITDVGMTGSYFSSIGLDFSETINRFTTGIPTKADVAKGKCIFNALLVDIDELSGKTNNVSLINEIID